MKELLFTVKNTFSVSGGLVLLPGAPRDKAIGAEVELHLPNGSVVLARVAKTGHFARAEVNPLLIALSPKDLQVLPGTEVWSL